MLVPKTKVEFSLRGEAAKEGRPEQLNGVLKIYESLREVVDSGC